MVARIKDTFCSMHISHVHEGFEVTKMAAHAQLLQLNLGVHTTSLDNHMVR